MIETPLKKHLGFLLSLDNFYTLKCKCLSIIVSSPNPNFLDSSSPISQKDSMTYLFLISTRGTHKKTIEPLLQGVPF